MPCPTRMPTWLHISTRSAFARHVAPPVEDLVDQAVEEGERRHHRRRDPVTARIEVGGAEEHAGQDTRRDGDVVHQLLAALQDLLVDGAVPDGVHRDAHAEDHRPEGHEPRLARKGDVVQVAGEQEASGRRAEAQHQPHPGDVDAGVLAHRTRGSGRRRREAQTGRTSCGKLTGAGRGTGWARVRSRRGRSRSVWPRARPTWRSFRARGTTARPPEHVVLPAGQLGSDRGVDVPRSPDGEGTAPVERGDAELARAVVAIRLGEERAGRVRPAADGRARGAARRCPGGAGARPLRWRRGGRGGRRAARRAQSSATSRQMFVSCIAIPRCAARLSAAASVRPITCDIMSPTTPATR